MDTETRSWHTLTPEAATAALDVNAAHGLATPRTDWLIFLDQFKSFLVIVLLFAAALAWMISDLKDAVVILVVVLFNASLGLFMLYVLNSWILFEHAG